MKSAGKLVFTLAAMAASMVAAAAYPDHTVEIIVPFPPGGSVDPVARALQKGMQEALGANIVILNQAGAAGTIGTAKVASAKPDGYTLGVTTVGPLTTQPHMNKLAYDVDSFSYICRTHVTPQVLVVPTDSPYKTLADLAAAGKADTNLTFSSTGTGSVPHLAMIEIADMLGLDWTHIPAKGDGDASTLVIGGEVTGFVAGVQTYSRLSDRLRALGLLEDERSSFLEDVPTFKEQGYDISSAGWGGLIAPRGTPPDVIAALSTACEKATQTPEYKAILKTYLVPQAYLAAEPFGQFVRKEYDRYGKLIESGKAK